MEAFSTQVFLLLSGKSVASELLLMMRRAIFSRVNGAS
jgi:hypothetical protein